MGRSLLMSALVLSLGATASFAQNTGELDKEAQRPSQQAAAQTQASQAGEQAAALSAGGEADVTFEQVSADPDNVDLNFRYARTQVRHGQLKGASATLERILLLNPDLPQIRLFYGVVLYRLDNLMEADREIQTALSQNPPDAVKAEANRYLAEIHKRQKRTQVTGRVGVGIEYDDNRNAAPASGIAQFFGAPVILNSASTRQGDTAVLFTGNVEAHHDLGLAAGHELFGTVNYYRAEQTHEKNLNLTAYSPALGGVYKTPFFNVTPQFNYDYVLLGQTTYLRTRAVDLRVDKTLSARAAVYADVHDAYQSYSPTAFVPTASDRTGIQVDSTLGGDYSLCAVNRLGADVLYTVKHGQNNAFTFFRKGFGVNDTWLLGRGTFLLSNFYLNVDNYDHADPLVGPGLRRDTGLSTGFTYGAPLSLINAHLKDVVLTFTYNYFDSMSTISNYSYTNNKISGLLTYKFAAGF